MTMGLLDGRVCIVTGAGRGLGREHALALAAEGADVVVNDLGGNLDGTGSDIGPAGEVVAEIEAMGARAVANTDSVTDWEGAQRMINQAVETFGDLHVLVNNAGILRDRVMVNTTSEEWDAVIDVHLRGHFAPARWASAYWREKFKKDNAPVMGSIINTASAAMLGNPGQANYSAAKAGIAAMTLVQAMELRRYGVRANALCPVARTRMTLQVPGTGDSLNVPDDPARFDAYDPANVSPLVAYLATADCPFNGGVFHVGGNDVALFDGWSIQDDQMLTTDGRWTPQGLQEAAPRLLEGRGKVASRTFNVGAIFKGFGRRKSNT